jgi:glycine dehydrogenase subunit 1
MAAKAHPYMANSTPTAKRRMLDALGLDDVDRLFEQIPPDHRLARPLALPNGIRSEAELRRELLGKISRNQDCERNLSFLGGGCWQHYVPAVCDEIISRTEFVTAIWGTPASDLGRNQAWFEFTSQLGELLELDFVGLPTYSWGCAAGHAIRMAARMTGRRELLVLGPVDPERMSVIRNYCQPTEMADHIKVRVLDCDWSSGQVDLQRLEEALSDAIAAVYFENPSFLGTIETAGAEIAGAAHRHGAEVIVGVDPISLGVLAPPSRYGADIAVGPMQPLGLHMNCGGSTGGFIASRDEERYAREYPTLTLSICETSREGERAFAMAQFEQTSYGSRDAANDWTGTSVYLWAIANAVYMSLLGPQGFVELDELILSRSHYAAQRLAEIPGVEVKLSGPFFKELVVGFEQTGKSVAAINAGLREHGIFGGLDLTRHLPQLGASALYCFTEVHTQADIDRLTTTMERVVAR